MKIRLTFPLLIAVALAIAFDRGGFLLLTFAAAAVHELGHMAAIMLCGGRLESLVAGLSGARMVYSAGGQASYLQDALIAFTGPLASAAAALIGGVAAHYRPSENLYFFIGASAVFCVFNLLPCIPLDGGRIAFALIAHTGEREKAEAILLAFSIATGVVLVAAGFVIFYATRRNITLLLTGTVILFGLNDKISLHPGKKRVL